MFGGEHQYYPQAKPAYFDTLGKKKRAWVACPVCFENLAKVFSFPKTSMLSKTKHKSMVLCQFVPYPGTVHCTVQVQGRVPGAEVPHIYMGFESHIYTQLVEPAKTALN